LAARPLRSFAATGSVLWRFADVVMCCVLCRRGLMAREINRSLAARLGDFRDVDEGLTRNRR
jgi:hypothetical protein